MSNNSSTLSQDTAFDLLSNARRRLALQYLQEANGPVSIGELATQVAAMENDIPVEEVDSQQRKRTYVSLYQTHVPKLAKAGAVEYDAEEGIVELDGDARMITSYLSPSRPDENWPRYYLLVSIVGLAGYLAALFVEALNSLLVGVVVILLFLVMSGLHYWSVRRNGPIQIDIGV